MKLFVALPALLLVASASVARSPVSTIKDQLPNSRIIGGYLATPGQLPYQVFLETELPSGSSWCGASIISADWVVTAAHCVYG